MKNVLVVLATCMISNQWQGGGFLKLSAINGGLFLLFKKKKLKKIMIKMNEAKSEPNFAC